MGCRGIGAGPDRMGRIEVKLGEVDPSQTARKGIDKLNIFIRRTIFVEESGSNTRD